MCKLLREKKNNSDSDKTCEYKNVFVECIKIQIDDITL